MLVSSDIDSFPLCISSDSHIFCIDFKHFDTDLIEIFSDKFIFILAKKHIYSYLLLLGLELTTRVETTRRI